MRYFKFLIVFLLLGCNRSSLQLPAISTDFLTKICKLNGVEKIRIRIYRQEGENYEKTRVECINVSGFKLEKLQIVIDYHNPLVKGDIMHYTFVLDTLSDQVPRSVWLPFQTEVLEDSLFVVGVLSENGNQEYLSGYYSGYYLYFEDSLHNVIGNPESVNGMIQADGTTDLFFSKGSDVNFKLIGTFIDSTLFNTGWLYSSNSQPRLIHLDTLSGNQISAQRNGNKVSFRLSISSDLADQSRYLLFNLIRN